MTTVLLMDDDENVLLTVGKFLTHAGYEVLDYPDAAPALDEVDFDAVDLIVTDFAMPTRGDQAIEIIRGRGITVPVIVISGALQAAEIEHLTDLGVDRILPKPFTVQELIRAVGEVLPGL